MPKGLKELSSSLKSDGLTAVFLRYLNHSPRYSMNPNSGLLLLMEVLLGFSIKYYIWSVVSSFFFRDTSYTYTQSPLCGFSFNQFLSELFHFFLNLIFILMVVYLLTSLPFIKFYFWLVFAFFLLFVSWVHVNSCFILPFSVHLCS